MTNRQRQLRAELVGGPICGRVINLVSDRYPGSLLVEPPKHPTKEQIEARHGPAAASIPITGATEPVVYVKHPLPPRRRYPWRAAIYLYEPMADRIEGVQ